MSIKVMVRVWDLPIPTVEKFVLLAIADACSDDGFAWPSKNTIASRCSIDRSTAIRAINRLAADGLLTIEKRRRPNGSHTSCRYQVNLDNIAPSGTAPLALVAQRHHPSGTAPLPEPSLEHNTCVPPSAPRRAEKKPLSDHAWMVRWWCHAFQVLQGERYAINAKAAGIIKTLLNTLPLEELLVRAVCYLDLSPARRFPRGGAPTLEGLSTMVNQLAGMPSAEAEERLFTAGLLPDFDNADIRHFTPWESAA